MRMLCHSSVCVCSPLAWCVVCLAYSAGPARSLAWLGHHHFFGVVRCITVLRNVDVCASLVCVTSCDQVVQAMGLILPLVVSVVFSSWSVSSFFHRALWIRLEHERLEETQSGSRQRSPPKAMLDSSGIVSTVVWACSLRCAAWPYPARWFITHCKAAFCAAAINFCSSASHVWQAWHKACCPSANKVLASEAPYFLQQSC